MKDTSVTAVNAALTSLQKEAYGTKAKSTCEMYAKYVSREYVPDRFHVSSRGGATQPTSLSDLVVSGAGAASQPATLTSTQASQTEGGGSGVGVPRKVRWSAPAHLAPLVVALLGPPFMGELPKKLAGWTQLAAKMPAPSAGKEWDVETLKRHAKGFAEEWADIRG
ncbi:hypothetical protein I4F81_012290 [Pyropia yezoensis]|uniref:Uncharacterized protein n=1 Tax=Pyropia yezoensis TaxID=2788 RepID=A0ACC3CIQ3_PYRYE|nr:hypothetical protein I4F81_012290 [Neopyropia yezoensis]